MNDSEPFCGQTWSKFQYFITNELYFSVGLILDIVGIPLNTFTVLVFVKKNVHSSSNFLFTSLAISDWTISMLGIPQLWLRISHRNIRYSLDRSLYTNSQRIIDHYMAIFEQLFYNVSLCETMLLAVWRYIAVTYPLKERVLCNVKVTVASVICIHVFCILFFKYDLMYIFRESSTSHNGTDFSDLTNGGPKLNFEFLTKIFYNWVDIILLKIVPSIIVGICTARFVIVLRKSKKNRKQMIPQSKTHPIEKHTEMNRTTKMVLGITTFYLINNTLFASGGILNEIYGEKFEKDCSPAIVCVNNTLAFIYTIIPFFVYYVTSAQFRDTFKSLFRTARSISPADTKVIRI